LVNVFQKVRWLGVECAKACRKPVSNLKDALEMGRSIPLSQEAEWRTRSDIRHAVWEPLESPSRVNCKNHEKDTCPKKFFAAEGCCIWEIRSSIVAFVSASDLGFQGKGNGIPEAEWIP
jgi:hypothetical protein